MISPVVLVIGDLMLGRAWVVSERTPITVQAHGDVPPLRRIRPQFRDTRLSGAGMTAAALAATGDTEVHLLASYNPADAGVFRTLGLVPAEDACNNPALGEIIYHQIPTLGPRITTVKHRIYSNRPNGPPDLCFRFDQDAPPLSLPTDQSSLLPATLQSSLPVTAVVVMDFAKGAVQDPLLRAINQRYDTAKWFVDSKNPYIFTEFSSLASIKGLVLFASRTETTRLHSNLPGRRSVVPLRLTDPGIWHEPILEIGRDLVQTSPNWTYVLKLDRDGAFVFWQNGGEIYHASATVPPLPTPGIAAGDLLLAEWVRQSVTGSQDRERLLKLACKHATNWVYVAETLFWEEGVFIRESRELPIPSDLEILSTPSLNVPRLTIEVEVTPKKTVKQALEQLKSARRYPALLGSGSNQRIRLSDARKYLGDFLTVNPTRGQELAALRDEIVQHIQKAPPKRPLNCLLWAQPGSGKSFLARQIARFASAEVYEINVAQCPSRQDFVATLAAVAACGYENLVLLLDEVDTFINGAPVFPLLLSPLWDGEIHYNGRIANLGKNFVSLLITSNTKYRDADNFIQALEGEDFRDYKGPDLVSRLTGPILTLQEPDTADRAYIVASLIKRYYSDVGQVTRGVLDFLVHSALPPRKLEYLILSLRHPRDGRLTCGDLRETFGNRPNNVLRRLGIDDSRGDALESYLTDANSNDTVFIQD